MGGIIKHLKPDGNPPFETFLIFFFYVRSFGNQNLKGKFSFFFQELHFSVDFEEMSYKNELS